MFVDKGDHLILPDMLWGNYNLTFGTCSGAIIKKHPTFTVTGGYDIDAFKAELKKHRRRERKGHGPAQLPQQPKRLHPDRCRR